MANLFSSPSPPREDPNVTAMRNAEQQRAELERTRSLQALLGAETTRRNRGFGTRSLLGPLGVGGARGPTSLLGSG